MIGSVRIGGRAWTTTVAAILIGISAAGCGGPAGPKPPPLGEVTGTVKLDGQPVKNAFVQFIPDNARPSTARTDDQGRFELYFNDKLKGAAVGSNTVKISARDAQPEKGNLETIPAKYNDKSELKETVKEGKNNFDFDLKSK
ncbi:MAG: hypothetical protein IT428_08545 [Planctomycetaceae bacterium]|nr:hypothetical protein [Planctomycetaceae bacterium]